MYSLYILKNQLSVCLYLWHGASPTDSERSINKSVSAAHRLSLNPTSPCFIHFSQEARGIMVTHCISTA